MKVFKRIETYLVWRYNYDLQLWKELFTLKAVFKVFLEDKIRGNGIHLESEIQADIRKASFLSVEVVKHWNEGGSWVMSFSKLLPVALQWEGISYLSQNQTPLIGSQGQLREAGGDY